MKLHSIGNYIFCVAVYPVRSSSQVQVESLLYSSLIKLNYTTNYFNNFRTALGSQKLLALSEL
eukprot:snap_masked-scaffold_9-processed-gene-8.43-mRNA-1 protein AED:1.00 eAED:1.00 QI:0/0/0/0/1/1/4/0/62